MDCSLLFLYQAEIREGARQLIERSHRHEQKQPSPDHLISPESHEILLRVYHAL